MLALTAGEHMAWQSFGKWRGKKEKKKKPWSKPSHLASDQRGERAKSPLIFSLSAYTSMFGSEISHFSSWPGSRQNLEDLTKSLYFPDQPRKDPDSLTCSGKGSLWIMQLLEHFYLNKWHKCPGFIAQPCEMKVHIKAPPGEAGFCLSFSPLLCFVLPLSPERRQASYLWSLLVQCSKH